MPINESYQQAILNGALQSLLETAGDSFTLVLFYSGTELSGNGYERKSISTIPEASEAGENGLSTVRLITDTLMTASGGNITWDALELRDSSGDALLFPRFSVSGTILSGESKKVTAVFGLPDNDALYSRVSSLESETDELAEDITELTGTVTNLDSELTGVSMDLDTVTTTLTAVSAEVDVLDSIVPTPCTTQAAIQAALDTSKTTGKDTVVAAGDIVLTSPINWYNVSSGNTKVGGDLLGKGKGEPYAIDQPNRGVVTNLVVPGSKSANQSAILYKGLYSKIRGFLISGKYATDAESVPKLPNGLDVRWTGGGAGKLNAQDLFFYWCDKAVRLAATSTELNCDESPWSNLNFIGCNTCFEFNSLQTMSHRFESLYVGSCGKVFDVFGGGSTQIDNLLIQNEIDVVLNFNADNPSSYGWNNSGWEFNFVKFDSQAANSKLVTMEEAEGYYSDVLFNRVQYPVMQWTNEIMNLSGRTKTTLANSVCVPVGKINWTSPSSTAVPTIILENNTFLPWTAEEDAMTTIPEMFAPNLPTSKNDSYVIARNNFRWENLGAGSRKLTRIPDFEGTFEGTI